MNLVHFATFLAILETGSLVRASERLNVTQSTVTARLKGLEEELGQSLFLRQKSGVQLTAAGSNFRRYASAMTGLWRQAQQEIALPVGAEAVCNIGCHMDLWPILGQQIVRKIRQAISKTMISVWPCDESDLDQWLNSGLVDLALSFRSSTQEARSNRLVREEQLILVTTDPESPITFDPGYVFVDAGEAFGSRHHTAYAGSSIAKVSYGSAAWALDHLLAHGGSAYLPDLLAAPLIAAGRLHRKTEAPVFSRSVFLISNDAAADGWPWLQDVIADLPA